MVDFLLYLQYNCIYAKLELKIYSKEHQPINSIMALKEGKVDLAVVSASCNISSPLKMRRVLGYQDILIGGTKYQELKGKRISLESIV